TNFEKAQGATGMADEQKRLAGEALHRAQQERQNAETAAVSIVHSVLANATEQIRLLDYAGAEATLRDASKLVQDKPQDNPLGKLKSEVANTLLEAAFFFAESGQYAQAGPALSTAARLLGQTPPMLPEEIERWRTALQTLSPQPYQKLQQRYFGDFVTIQGGAYQMDSSYTVTLSSFELASTETTVWQYNLFCAAQGRSVADRTAADHSSVEKTSDPGWGWQGDHPVVYVNWYDAVEYANWLSGKLGLAPAYSIDALTKDTSNQSSYDTYKWTVKPKPGANGYRLPTEAEWEYAATNRGADQFIYAGDSILNTVGWYGENSSNRTHAVKTKTANGLRLFDLSGNVWEWCWDWYADEYPSEAQKNPTGPPEGSLRVLRGGSWRYDAVSARVRYRYDGYPLYRFDLCGFRLARAVNF
ncbi:MAG: SUMF1/EgtB/PvdO family nonheme iron enzyme, partial [Saprospiraceae bacterium]